MTNKEKKLNPGAGLLFVHHDLPELSPACSALCSE
jgi:hypothetical protein